MAGCCLLGGCVTVMVLKLDLFVEAEASFSLVLPHLDGSPATPVATA